MNVFESKLNSSVFSWQVNEELMTGVSHSKAVATIRKTKGLVHLIVSRPHDQSPSTYLAYLPMNSDKCNGNTGRSKEPGGGQSVASCHLLSLI